MKSESRAVGPGDSEAPAARTLTGLNCNNEKSRKTKIPDTTRVCISLILINIRRRILRKEIQLDFKSDTELGDATETLDWIAK